MIRAVLFDLDDTLYPQTAWLEGAWKAVAAGAAAMGAPEAELFDALCAIAAEGSDRGRIIDRALERCGHADVSIAPLLVAFRMHAPAQLEPYPGAREGLAALRTQARVGIVTDGDPHVQRAKVQALQLDVDVVVCSDDLGRDRRKPHPLPFRHALAKLGVHAGEAVFVGDRPTKDIAGAAAVGMRTVRVRTGEYASAPDEPAAWRTVATVADAMKMLQDQIAAERLVVARERA